MVTELHPIRTWKQPFRGNRNILNILWRIILVVTSPIWATIGVVGGVIFIVVVACVLNPFLACGNFILYGDLKSPLTKE